MATGRIHSIETFGLVDGPGVRFVTFMQGCNLRCAFCHNPDTWNMSGGEEIEASKLFEKALRYKPYWKDNGGVTLSGGEPLLQMDFVKAYFSLAKKKGIHTALDTSGNIFKRDPEFLSKLDEVLKVTDLVILDIKEIENDDHIALTGKPNTSILDFARYLSETGKHMWIRHVLVPGGSDDDAKLKKLSEFIDTLSNVDRVEVLPYHTLGTYKYDELGISYPLAGVNPPDDERIKNANSILKTDSYNY